MGSKTDEPEAGADRRRLFRMLAAAGLVGLLVLIGRGAVESAAALFPLAESANPYFVPQHAFLLYVWVPLVVVSASALLLSPGLFLALAAGLSRSLAEWVLSALPISIVVVSGAAAIAQHGLRQPLRGAGFVAVVVSCTLFGWAVAAWRTARGPGLIWPPRAPGMAGAVSALFVMPWLWLVLLAPKFHWENFTGDGAHAFESARLLLVQALPFWSPAVGGEIASFPGITSVLFIYPLSWFIRLFGPFEASVRFPVLLEVVALHSGIVALIEHGRSKPMASIERWLIWLFASTYLVVMAFSATYSAYSADMALPAAQDTLAMACFLGFVLWFARGGLGWSSFFLVLTYLALPNAMLLVGLCTAAALLLWRPRPWRTARQVAAVGLACALASAVVPYLLTALGLPEPGGEYGLLNFAQRFALLQFTDWRRFAFVAIPGGILPAVALFAWTRQDSLARVLTLVTVAYFMFFFVQGKTLLHYYVPAMVMPVIVFWRTVGQLPVRQRRAVAWASLAGLVVAMFLSLPERLTLYATARRIGAGIEDQLGGYDVSAPAAMRRIMLLRALFAPPWDPRVPDQAYGVSSLALSFYAHQPRSFGGYDPPPNYVIRSAADRRDGALLVAESDGAGLFVRDSAVWSAHTAVRPATPAGSSLYTISPAVIYGSPRMREELRVIDLNSFALRLGFDVRSMLDRRRRDQPR